ncbi:MAG: ATP-binding protein [Verrucomicrobiota bacterium JB022]|nr:ATP-binding protein [Verrucomicrobiota bacterium JB022]
MKRSYLPLLAAAILSSAATATAQTLTKVWETEPVLTTCESALYYHTGDYIFVSNIVGNPAEADGVGFISKVSTEGKVLELKWVEGLDAPKGLAISDGKLYVADLDDLVEIDLATGKILKRYPVKDAVFLNDVAAYAGKVYVSDTRTGKVHVLKKGKISLFADDREGVNGLQFRNGKLYALDNLGFRQYPLDGSAPEMVSDGVKGGDGLVALTGDTWVASHWSGEVFLVQGSKATQMLDTREQGLNTADIGYIPAERLVLVPTFAGNTVAAYRLEY